MSAVSLRDRGATVSLVCSWPMNGVLQCMRHPTRQLASKSIGSKSANVSKVKVLVSLGQN